MPVARKSNHSGNKTGSQLQNANRFTIVQGSKQYNRGGKMVNKGVYILTRPVLNTAFAAVHFLDHE